jgi:FkbM family methyltransferase
MLETKKEPQKKLHATTPRDNWLSSMNWQIDFYKEASKKQRADREFAWTWYEEMRRPGFRTMAKSLLSRTLNGNPSQPGFSQEWLASHAAELWESRILLEDELSRLLFDSMLVLRCSSHGQFYFPRIDFEDFVSVAGEEAFVSRELPADYLGLPLRVFKLALRPPCHIPSLAVVSTRAQIDLLNSYRQYFIRRGSRDVTPVADEVVLDCGACIGEISTVLAGLVAPHGEVHLFEPVPLHARYCELQASLNPALAPMFRINVLAVGDVSRTVAGSNADVSSISPGGLATDSFSVTTLDDYVARNRLERVDFIKMDIEGAEMAALTGAAEVIRGFRPRLAISAYHKPEDLWEIPHKLKTQNPDYRFYFGHHSPIPWESVYYAG